MSRSTSYRREGTWALTNVIYASHAAPAKDSCIKTDREGTVIDVFVRGSILIIMSAARSDEAIPPLLAVLASPPSGTTGQRTLARVSMAASLIGCDDYEVANIFAEPTADVLSISAAGVTSTHWMTAREALKPLIAGADNVLFAWGKTEPTGPARKFHRAQIEWLIHQTSLTTAAIWMVGAEPRHPSRWQRYTSREHPHLPFVQALSLALRVGGAEELEGRIRVKVR